MKKNVVLIGGGSQANIVIDILEQAQEYSIVGVLDSKKEIHDSFKGYSILGRQESLPEVKEKLNVFGTIICIGDNWLRAKVADQVQNLCPEIVFVNAVHPSVIIGKDVKMGDGNVIMAGVILNPDANIGNHCFISTKSSMEHNTVLGDYSSISAGVTTGGFMTLGKFSHIALGVTIFDRVHVGEHTVVGSGALVTKDLPGKVLAYGVPAKVIRKREIGEKYLK
jgi:sugar O-acyltransferase (sialic acid O-acetyltransferase NeuD family)